MSVLNSERELTVTRCHGGWNALARAFQGWLHVASLAILALSASASAALGEGPVIQEFDLSNTTPPLNPGDIAPGPDGNLWFTSPSNGTGPAAIGVMGTDGTLRTIFTFPSLSLAAPSLSPTLVTGPDGNVWFCEYPNGVVGRLTPAGTLTEFNAPGFLAVPYTITVGPDGALWVAELGHQIGRITTQGASTAYSLPDTIIPSSITTGPDGNLWIANFGDSIGRLTPLGSYTDFPLTSPIPLPIEPAQITTGPDGNLWWTNLYALRQIGRITTSGVATQFNLPNSASLPTGIVAGPDGNLWFTDLATNAIGRITTNGQVAEYPVPTSAAFLSGITLGPDGNLWFTEYKAHKIGRVILSATGAGCRPSATTLCIDDRPGDGRWQLTATYATAQGGGRSGNGEAIALTTLGISEGGLLWFFDASNPEMLVKVINACALNQHFWVFYAATTNVGFKLNVLDTKTGSAKSFSNTDGVAAAPIQATAAFACTNGDVAGSGGTINAPADAGVTSDRAPEMPTTAPVVSAQDTCTPSAAELCLDGRFSVQASFHTQQGGGLSGKGHAISLQSLGAPSGGLYWFFDSSNPEMLIKVIDGCALNGHYWVFYAATTNVGFTVTVTDQNTGHTHQYSNVDGTSAPPVQDTSALSCP
jgi:streptogramin lyase